MAFGFTVSGHSREHPPSWGTRKLQTTCCKCFRGEKANFPRIYRTLSHSVSARCTCYNNTPSLIGNFNRCLKKQCETDLIFPALPALFFFFLFVWLLLNLPADRSRARWDSVRAVEWGMPRVHDGPRRLGEVPALSAVRYQLTLLGKTPVPDSTLPR